MLHIVSGAVLATYIYSPLGDFALLQVLVKAVLLPAVAISGLWLWKEHAAKRLFKSKAVLLILLSLASIDHVMAQENHTTLEKTKRWGIEYSPIGLGLFRISQGKATYAVNVHSKFKTELGLGVMAQPYSTTKGSESFNQDGEYSALMASIGVRQYLWKGLHFEEVVNMGRGSIRNSLVDGADYDAFVIFT